MKIISIILTIFASAILAQSVTVTGDWNFTIPSTDITEAGLDFTGNYESNYNQAYLQINHPSKWKLEININEIYWHEDLILKIRRTGDGVGPKKIGGGELWIELNVTPQNFFKGDNDRFAVPIQYYLENISVLLPAENYTVDVVYTLISG